MLSTHRNRYTFAKINTESWKLFRIWQRTKVSIYFSPKRKIKNERHTRSVTKRVRACQSFEINVLFAEVYFLSQRCESRAGERNVKLILYLRKVLPKYSPVQSQMMYSRCNCYTYLLLRIICNIILHFQI